MLELINIILPIFLVILLGLVFKKTGFITESFIQVSNRLTFYFFLPILLFYNISNSDFKNEFNTNAVLVLIIATITVFVLGFVVAKIMRLNARQTGTFVMNSFRGNVGYIGLALGYYVYGDSGLTAAGIIIAFATPLVNVLSIIALGFSSYSFKILIVIKDTMLNPLVIASLIGIGVSLIGIDIPVFFGRTLGIISDITLPLALIAIGSNINFSQIKGSRVVIIISSLIKLIILPLIAYVSFRVIGDTSIIAKVVVLLLACPTAAVAYICADSMGGDAELANSTIVITTIGSIFTFIMWLRILGY